MARSDLQGFFGQLFPRRASSSGRAADSGRFSEEVASSRRTGAGSQSRALPANYVPTTGPPWPFPNGEILSSGEHIALLEHLRDTGDPNEQLCAEYKLQNLRHSEQFSALKARAWKAQRQLEEQVDKECETTQSAFDAARALREKEVLGLRETLERNDERARECLRDRVLQQCDRHNLLAQRGIEACIRFAEIVLSGEVEIGRNVVARVRSQVDVFEHRDGVVGSRSDSAHTRLSVRIQEGLRQGGRAHNSSQRGAFGRNDTSLPLSTRTRRHSYPTLVKRTVVLADPSREESKPDPIPSPRLPVGPPQDGGSPGPSPAQDIQPPDAGFLEVFDTHFGDQEKERERQWRDLLEQHDAHISVWRDRYRALLASLASKFASEDASGGSENAVKAADQADRASARETVSYEDRRRAEDMKRLWDQTKAMFLMHHDAFVERLRAAERGLESNDYTPQALVPLPPRPAAFWMPARRRAVPSLSSMADTRDLPRYSLPVSFANLLTLPRVSRALPTAPPRAQMRTSFRDAQTRRDRQFEGKLAAFEAESQAVERKHELALTSDIRSWRTQADTAERERAALFSLRIKAAREEWDSYRAQRDEDADGLVREFEESFAHAQAAREAEFMEDVRKLHEHFTRVVQELLDM